MKLSRSESSVTAPGRPAKSEETCHFCQILWDGPAGYLKPVYGTRVLLQVRLYLWTVLILILDKYRWTVNARYAQHTHACY